MLFVLVFGEAGVEKNDSFGGEVEKIAGFPQSRFGYPHSFPDEICKLCKAVLG